MKITFIGANHEVTGSCTLLELNGRYYMVDCGMEQGADVFENVPLPVAPSAVEAVFLTHAHIDHSGLLPKLCKDGFRGTIYATSATADLCSIMLADSAHIQESDAEWLNRKAERAGGTKTEPLYTITDAETALRLFRPCRYGERLAVGDGLQVRFNDAGHLLGSASIELWLSEGGEERKIVFSGDVGNTNQPIIKDPSRIEETDYLVLESTYGDRLHERPEDGRESTLQELAGIIQRTLDRGGNLVIPSFAVGRTQEMLYAIRAIKEQGLVKGHGSFPVYVDSPLAAEATNIFLQCDMDYFDEETRAVLKRGVNPIWSEGLELSVSQEDSRAINENKQPKVILSASGMCDAGRIRHHLKHNLWQARNTVLFVGYQAEGSLGRKLQDGAEEVTLFGEKIAVRAEICTLHGTSGHADRDGLIAFLQGFTEKPQTVFLNHGEDAVMASFRELLTKEYGYRVETPYSGTEYDLITGHMTVYTEGRRIEKKAAPGRDPRALTAYNNLVQAAQELLELAKSCRGRANKDLGRFTDQLRSLIEKWK